MACRFVARPCCGGFCGRRAGYALVGAGVAGFGLVAIAWQVGWFGAVVTEARNGLIAVSATAGFRVEEALLTGRREADAVAVLAALSVGEGDPIFELDLDAARTAIEAVPWVRHARVERRLPDTILIALEEHRPLALWQHQRRLHLVAEDGSVLAEDELGPWSDLLLVVGDGAPTAVPELLGALDRVPTVADRVAAATWVGGRRWELRLDNGVDVRLPEQDMPQALARLAAVEAQDRVMDRDILAIDLRISDRLVLQATPMAAERLRLPEEET